MSIHSVPSGVAHSRVTSTKQGLGGGILELESVRKRPQKASSSLERDASAAAVSCAPKAPTANNATAQITFETNFIVPTDTRE